VLDHALAVSAVLEAVAVSSVSLEALVALALQAVLAASVAATAVPVSVLDSMSTSAVYKA